MPEFDLTVTIPVILAICAIISPILTAIINNRYLLKPKKLDLKQQYYEKHVLHAREVFENYLMATEKFLYDPHHSHRANYQKYYTAVLLYVETDVLADISALDNCIQNQNTESAEKLIALVSTKMNKQLRKPLSAKQ